MTHIVGQTGCGQAPVQAFDPWHVSRFEPADLNLYF